MFIDFQKSFDNVSRPILSHKLQTIGIFDLGYIMIVVVRLQIKQLQIKPKKQIRDFKGIRAHGLCVSTAVLCQLSYEDPCIGSRLIC